MKLTIVIPAYDEEEAIASIIERTLDARRNIVEQSPVSEIDVVVVSDGSTDNTAAIARRYEEITLIEFERNRGYGAAIKRGFAETDSALVGFLDADGTCDPEFFADLCSALAASGAAVALGSRMGPHSRMPRVRRLGNKIYAGILSVLTNRIVHDTASGMRVIRREALQRLYPLPDGLNFTPAMSARALLDEALPVIELPMSYEERVGESKLNVLSDGWRFFQTIMEMTLLLRPARVFLSGAAVCGLVTLLLAAHPFEMWLSERRLEESMIYRLLFCSFLGSLAVLFMSALMVSEALRGFARGAHQQPTLFHRILQEVFSARGLLCISLALSSIGAVLVGPGIWSWIVERQVYIHWSRVVLAGLLMFALCQMLVTKIILTVVGLHVSRHQYVQRCARHKQASAPAQRRPAAIPGNVVLT